MQPPPSLPVRHELPGWELLWARLALRPDRDADRLAAFRAAGEERARAALDLSTLAEHPTAAALRALFRAAGCDPTRYRPSSEALLRRVLKGEPLPAIHPLVDLNNVLSIDLLVPACIVDAASVVPPLVLRAGREGESFESLRGPLGLAGKPLLVDASGPFGTPITDSVRAKVRPETADVWLVAYLPRGVVAPETALGRLHELAAEAGVAAIGETGATS